MAAAVGAPWVLVWTGGPSALLAHLQGDALGDDIRDKAASRADELLTAHPGLGSYRVRDLPDGRVFGNMHLSIVALFRRVADQLHVPGAATAIALNSFPGLLPDDITAEGLTHAISMILFARSTSQSKWLEEIHVLKVDAPLP
ncbi:Anthocyanidin 3-O-glucosyltransferase [Hordeum vulgare]|nr:Anthocyanidin 3-O-glucosyltransferase [Hordeum vulgare]